MKLNHQAGKLFASLLLATQLLSPISTFAQEIEVVEEKPAVAEIAKNNKPNRLVVTFNGDTQTQMGFNWYTSELVEDAKVWVSQSEDMSDALEFTATAQEVTSRYGERDENGFYIFSDIAYDEEGEVVLDEAGEPEINGYFTDEGITTDNTDWMYGASGLLGLVDVTEYVYKAVATDLEADTTYYY